MIGKRNCSGHNVGESGLISQEGESLMGFLELRQEPVVYSRVPAGCTFETLDCSLKSGTCLGMRDIPSVTREYTPGSCRNSRKPMRLSPSLEMRSDSPALCPEQLRFPNQTGKEPRFARMNSRESPTTLSQDEKNTDVTPGMQNCSVYPKSN